jgi:hypothetical protein
MERRGCGLGCIVALLGLIMTCCLVPYLFSSIYSIIGSMFNMPVPETWLWGEWLSTLPLVSESQALYMVLAEGPLCCVGTIALLIAIMGLVTMIISVGRGEQYYDEQDQEYY